MSDELREILKDLAKYEYKNYGFDNCKDKVRQAEIEIKMLCKKWAISKKPLIKPDTYLDDNRMESVLYYARENEAYNHALADYAKNIEEG